MNSGTEYVLQYMIQSLSSDLDGVCGVFSEVSGVYSGYFYHTHTTTKNQLLTQKMDSCKHKIDLMFYCEFWYPIQYMMQSLPSGLDMGFAVCFRRFAVYIF